MKNFERFKTDGSSRIIKCLLLVTLLIIPSIELETVPYQKFLLALSSRNSSMDASFVPFYGFLSRITLIGTRAKTHLQ